MFSGVEGQEFWVEVLINAIFGLSSDTFVGKFLSECGLFCGRFRKLALLKEWREWLSHYYWNFCTLNCVCTELGVYIEIFVAVGWIIIEYLDFLLKIESNTAFITSKNHKFVVCPSDIE